LGEEGKKHNISNNGLGLDKKKLRQGGREKKEEKKQEMLYS